MNPYSPDLMTDQVIGSAYQVVKYVAANMETLLFLSDSIPTLTGYMPIIQAVLAEMPTLTNVSDNISVITNVNDNMITLLNINTNMAALLNINSNLAAILGVPVAIAAQDWKNSVVAATTANITLSGTQTIDGVTVLVGNRVLVKNQTAASQNGIYVVAADAWARASDAVAPNVSTNNTVMVERGTVGAGKIFRLSTTGTITVGTTAQTWVEFASGESNTTSNQGTGLELALPKDGVDLPFKTLKAGANVILTDNGDEIEISSSGGGGGGSGEANTTSNVGSGLHLAKTKVGSDLPFKTLVAGANVTLEDEGDEIVISSVGGGGSGGEVNTTSNVGTGEGLAKAKSGVNLPFKSLKAGANVTISSNENEITITATGGGSGGGSLTVNGDAGIDTLNTKAGHLVTESVNSTTKAIALDLGANSIVGNLLTATGVYSGAVQPIVEDFEDTTYNLTFVGDWNRTDAIAAHSGTFSFAPDNIVDYADNTTSIEDIAITVQSVLSFYYTTTEKAVYDEISLYLNGEYITSFSGDNPWTEYHIMLPVGTHTIAWTYYTEAGGSLSATSAYIDDVKILPGYPIDYQLADLPLNYLTKEEYTQDWNGATVVAKSVNLAWDPANFGRGRAYGTYPKPGSFNNKFLPWVAPSFGGKFHMDLTGTSINSAQVNMPVYNSPQHGVSALLSATDTTIAANSVMLYPIYIPRKTYVTAFTCTLAATFASSISVALYDIDPETGLPDLLLGSKTTTVSSSNAVSCPLGVSSKLDQGMYWVAINFGIGATLKSIDSWRGYSSGQIVGLVGTSKTPAAEWPVDYSGLLTAADKSLFIPLLGVTLYSD